MRSSEKRPSVARPAAKPMQGPSVLRDASKRNLLIFVALVAAVLGGSQLIGYVRLSRGESRAQAARTGAAGSPARGRALRVW